MSYQEYKERVLKKYPNVVFGEELDLCLDDSHKLNSPDIAALRSYYRSGTPILYKKSSKKYVFVTLGEASVMFVSAKKSFDYVVESDITLYAPTMKGHRCVLNESVFFQYIRCTDKLINNIKKDKTKENRMIKNSTLDKVLKETKENGKIITKLELGRLISKQVKKAIIKETGFFGKKKMRRYIDNPIFDIVLATAILGANDLTVRREEVEYAASALMLSGGESAVTKINISSLVDNFVKTNSKFFKDM